MKEKKAIQLQRDQGQLESPVSVRKRASLSQRNWRKMETSAKASLLKKLTAEEVKEIRKRVRKVGVVTARTHQKQEPAKKAPSTAPQNFLEEAKQPSPNRNSRLGRHLKREAGRQAASFLYQEDREEEGRTSQGLQKGRRGLEHVQTSLKLFHSSLSRSTKAHALSLSQKEDQADQKKRSPVLSPKRRNPSSLSLQRGIWGGRVRPVPVFFSSSVGRWTVWGIGGFLLFLLMMASVLSQTFPIQSEYDLNETYLYLTQLDRKNSTEEVEYYTNWEDPLLYLHYHYDRIHDVQRLNPDLSFMDQGAGRTYVEELWKDLNKAPHQLKTIQNLYQEEKTKYALSKEEQGEFEELMEESKEFGKFALLLELDNPFYLAEEPKVEEPLNIKERFGYTSPDKRTDTTILAIGGNHPLYAPLRGEVKVEDGTVTIEAADAKFTFYQVSHIRVETGQEVESGTQIGQTSPAGDQTISYQKKLVYTPKATLTNWSPEPREDWFYVNPGFYFQAVRYLEATYVKDLTVDGDKAKKVQLIKNYLTKELQKEGKQLSLKGLASILGNFDIESSITAKRAEGDYLSPPIGASSSSWDDPDWLSMSGPAIYNGRYSNILHRGLGLGQWTDTADGSVRHTMLLDYAKGKEKKWYDLELQLDFMLHGDSPYYRAVVRDILTSDASTDDLTLAFLVQWEGNPGDKLTARRQSAKQWEVYLKGGSTGTSTGTSSQTVPNEYKDKLPYGLPSNQAVLEGQGYPGNAYAPGQCTWFVYNRFYQIGKPIDPYLGNATNWASSSQLRGYQVTTEPQAGSAVVFLAGAGGSHPVYGHVGFCEAVNEDGSFLMSEMNAAGGLYSLSWRVLSPQTGIYFVTPK